MRLILLLMLILSTQIHGSLGCLPNPDGPDDLDGGGGNTGGGNTGGGNTGGGHGGGGGDSTKNGLITSLKKRKQ